MRSSEDQRPLFIYRAIEKKAGRSKIVVIGTDMKLHFNAIKQLTAVCNSASLSYWNVKFTDARAVCVDLKKKKKAKDKNQNHLTDKK